MRSLKEIGELSSYKDIKFSEATIKAFQTYASLYLDFADDNLQHFIWRDIDIGPIRRLEEKNIPLSDDAIRDAYYKNAIRIAKTVLNSYYEGSLESLLNDFPTLSGKISV